MVKTADAIDWIKAQEKAEPDRPWFAWVAYNLSHATIVQNPSAMMIPNRDTLDAKTIAEVEACGGKFGTMETGDCSGEAQFRAMTNSMDTLIGKLSAEIAPQLKAGTMVMTLDAAAPFAGHLPNRPDLVYFVAHPCHPSIFHPKVHVEGAPDYFGGVAAPQSIVSALMQGPDDAFTLGEDIAKTIYQPIQKAYRVTVEQMALLEPGLSETVCATLLDVMREAMDEVVTRGVPAEAARDFLLGHMTILSAVIFKQIPGQFSDACNKAIVNGKPRLMRDDWKKIFDREEIAESIERIT